MFWKLRLSQIWDGVKLAFGPLLNRPRNVKLLINEKTFNLLPENTSIPIDDGDELKDYKELQKLGKEQVKPV